MPMWKLFYHVVWATKGRHPLLRPEHEALVGRTIRAACSEQGAVLLAVGLMPDHIHVCASIPPSLAIGEAVGRWKGATSFLLNREGELGDATFAWQREYSIHSFGEKALPDVVAYVTDQPNRHRLGKLWEPLESFGDTPAGLLPSHSNSDHSDNGHDG